jgi:hypothetical protein
MRVARFQGTSILNDFKGLDVCEFGAEESHKPAHDPHSAGPVRLATYDDGEEPPPPLKMFAAMLSC